MINVIIAKLQHRAESYFEICISILNIGVAIVWDNCRIWNAYCMLVVGNNYYLGNAFNHL